MNTNENNGLRPNEEYLLEAERYYLEQMPHGVIMGSEIALKALDLLMEGMRKDLALANAVYWMLESGEIQAQFGFNELQKVVDMGKMLKRHGVFIKPEPPSTKQEGEGK